MLIFILHYNLYSGFRRMIVLTYGKISLKVSTEHWLTGAVSNIRKKLLATLKGRMERLGDTGMLVLLLFADDTFTYSELVASFVIQFYVRWGHMDLCPPPGAASCIFDFTTAKRKRTLPKPVLKTCWVAPNSLFTLLKERVRWDLKPLKNRHPDKQQAKVWGQ